MTAEIRTQHRCAEIRTKQAVCPRREEQVAGRGSWQEAAMNPVSRVAIPADAEQTAADSGIGRPELLLIGSRWSLLAIRHTGGEAAGTDDMVHMRPSRVS